MRLFTVAVLFLTSACASTEKTEVADADFDGFSEVEDCDIEGFEWRYHCSPWLYQCRRLYSG